MAEVAGAGAVDSTAMGGCNRYSWVQPLPWHWQWQGGSLQDGSSSNRGFWRIMAALECHLILFCFSVTESHHRVNPPLSRVKVCYQMVGASKTCLSLRQSLT